MSDRAGFTVVEMAIACTLLVILLGAAFTTIKRGRDASKQTISVIALDEGMQKILQQFADEVRWASRIAEDTNDNGKLDDGEDTNGNGRLEDDWSATTTSLTFNQRLADGGYRLPITYRQKGATLEKVVRFDASGKSNVTVVARNVTAFTVKDSSGSVKATLAIAFQGADGSTIRRTRSITVSPRN